MIGEIREIGETAEIDEIVVWIGEIVVWIGEIVVWIGEIGEWIAGWCVPL